MSRRTGSTARPRWRAARATASAWGALFGRVFVKNLRESLRRPFYVATVLGMPAALMLVFGAALDDGTPAPEDALDKVPDASRGLEERGHLIDAAAGSAPTPGRVETRTAPDALSPAGPDTASEPPLEPPSEPPSPASLVTGTAHGG